MLFHIRNVPNTNVFNKDHRLLAIESILIIIKFNDTV